MKKKRAVLVLSLIALSGLLISLVPPAKTNPDYEQNPPIPVAFWVKALSTPLPDGSNLRIRIKYDELEPMPSSLDIYTGNTFTPAVTIYDDGTNGDAVAGDNIYTGFMKEDLSAFQKRMTDLALLASKQPSLITFEGHLGKVLTGGVNFDATTFAHFGEVFIDKYLLEGFGCDWSCVKQNSLFITDTSVVEDHARTFNCYTWEGNMDGVYTLGAILKNVANTFTTGIHPKDLLKSWLKNYTEDVVVNGQTIAKRPDCIKYLIASWIYQASTVPLHGDITLDNWETYFDDSTDETKLLEFAPFKLTAIVNRIDLRGNSAYNGGLNNSGETRFIFTLIDRGSGLVPEQMNQDFIYPEFLDWRGMNLILEFGNVQKNLCDVRDFANKWLSLSYDTLGTEKYKEDLEGIAHTVLDAGAATGKTNGSALLRIRTNERIFSGIDNGWRASDWEFRQFQLDPGSGLFVQVPLTNTPVNAANDAQSYTSNYTPSLALNDSDAGNLINWVFSTQGNVTRVYKGLHNMPNVYGNRPLTSGGARVDAEYAHYWDLNWLADPTLANHYAPYDPVDEYSVYYKQVRQQLSLNTCQGCHNGETKTIFTHVMPTNYNQANNYWNAEPDYSTSHGGIDERFGGNGGASNTPPVATYAPPHSNEYFVRLSAFLTGRNYRVDSISYPGGHYYDDNDSDSNDSTLDGLFYVFSPDNSESSWLQVNSQIYGYNDLERRKHDLCRLIGTDCSPGVFNVMSEIAHLPLPHMGH